jgi:hypothetical protein
MVYVNNAKFEIQTFCCDSSKENNASFVAKPIFLHTIYPVFNVNDSVLYL